MGSDVQPPTPSSSGSGAQENLPESGTELSDFRPLADALPYLVWLCYPDGRLDYLNRQGLEYFGPFPTPLYSPFPCGPAIHPDDVGRVRAVWADALRTAQPVNVETRLLRADGAFLWHLNRAHPLLDGAGKVLRWIGTSTNVHDVREASERSAFLLSLSAELAPMGNPQELVCAAMIRLRERLGTALVTLVELDEVLGEAVVLRQRRSEGSQIEVAGLPLRPFRELASRARQGLLTVIRDLRQDGSASYLYDRWFGLDGVGAVLSAPLLQGGSLVALLSVVEAQPRDWTASEVELVQRVADIVWPAFEKARADRSVEEALKEMNRRKDEFLAMLGHELRNPLAPICSAVKIVKVHSSGNPQLEWAGSVIERQTRHLVRLVDDLLDVSRIVRGQIVLQRDEVDLAEVIRHGVETSGPLIEARHHRLHVQLPPGPLPVLGDLTRLAQVLANLLNNAAKYTDEGGDIWLEAHQESAQAQLRVRDSGAGIAPWLLPRVFELFTQAERTLDRAQGGLGIGLTLVKLLVEMHGGNVEAVSAGLGQGAEFIVRLPLKSGSSASVERVGTRGRGAVQEEEPMRVLVVDDNVDAADSTAMLLSMDGYDAHSVHSAQAALEAAETLKPDVVLLDIGLPEMDGYDVAKKLRALRQNARPTIVALTGYGQPADRDRAARAGFDEFLVKPVELEALSGLLKSLPAPVR